MWSQVDKHIRRLDADLKKFEAELEQQETKGKGKGATKTSKHKENGKGKNKKRYDLVLLIVHPFRVNFFPFRQPSHDRATARSSASAL